MRIVIPRESVAGERRTSATPETVKKMIRLGAEVAIESGAGEAVGFDDSIYAELGAEIVTDRAGLLGSADMVLRLRKPEPDDIGMMKSGCIHVSYLDPFNERDLIKTLADKGITAISMEMIPRSTRSQKMDALSSQANLAGYVAVMLAAAQLPRIFPMLMTPAGTLKPAKVFIIGAGVAGLQAIATAKRLGARVTAFDTRPVVAEQVQSLGGKFLEIDLGDTGQTSDGYAKELTPEQVEIQRQAQKDVIADSDVVITTAQVFGRKAPIIVTKDMLAAMKPGSVIVDCAASTGGNVEGIELNKELQRDKVTLIGLHDLAQYVPKHASEMYAANVAYFLEEFFDQEKKSFDLNLEDDIIKSMLTTYAGNLVQPMLVNHLNEQQGG